MDMEVTTKEKIVLPENTQREMMKFFLKTSIPKIADEKRKMESGESKKSAKSENGGGKD